MRLASIAKALVLSAALFACANTASIPDESDAGPGGGSLDDGSTGSPDATAVCKDPCASDLDCQNSCPAISGDVNCCDMTHRCYLSAGTMCPAAVVDSGPTMPPPAY